MFGRRLAVRRTRPSSAVALGIMNSYTDSASFFHQNEQSWQLWRRGAGLSDNMPFTRGVSLMMVRLNAPFHSSVIVRCSRLLTSHNLPGNCKTLPSMFYVELSSIITIATKTLHVFLWVLWLDITFHYIVDIRIISHLIVERAVTKNSFKLFLPFGLI